MTVKPEPWYIHAALYAVIVILVGVLIKVAIIDPKEIVKQEKYFRTEARLRMKNIKEGEILYQKKYNRFSGNLDSLIKFIKYDPYVDSVVNGFDSLVMKSSNPFLKLTDGEFSPDSLFRTPKTQRLFVLMVDTSKSVDTVVNQYGKLLRIDSTVVIGSRYYLEDPDGYGTVGDLNNDALKNTASWE